MLFVEEVFEFDEIDLRVHPGPEDRAAVDKFTTIPTWPTDAGPVCPSWFTCTPSNCC